MCPKLLVAVLALLAAFGVEVAAQGIGTRVTLAQQTLATKRCGKCGKEVPLTSRVGQRCPHCGVRWGYENDRSGNPFAQPRNQRTSDDFDPKLFGYCVLGVLAIGILVGVWNRVKHSRVSLSGWQGVGGRRGGARSGGFASRTAKPKAPAWPSKTGTPSRKVPANPKASSNAAVRDRRAMRQGASLPNSTGSKRAPASAPEKRKRLATLKVLVAVAAADGKIDSQERARLEVLCRQLGLDRQELDDLLAEPMAVDRKDLPESEEEKRKLLVEALRMAAADGRIDDRERRTVSRIAAFLGLSRDAVKTCVESAKCQTREPGVKKGLSPWAHVLDALKELEHARASTDISHALCDANSIIEECAHFCLDPHVVTIRAVTNAALDILDSRRHARVRVIRYAEAQYAWSINLRYSEGDFRSVMQLLAESPSAPAFAPGVGGQWDAGKRSPTKGTLEEFLKACTRLATPKKENAIAFSPGGRHISVSSTYSGGDYTVTDEYIAVKLGHDLFEWIAVSSSG